MIAFLDVDYREVGAVAAAVLAYDWTDSVPTAEITAFIPDVEEYVPGEFYRRELPCLQAALAQLCRAATFDCHRRLCVAGTGSPGAGGEIARCARWFDPSCWCCED